MSNESTEQQGVEAIPMGILAANMKAERKRNKVSRAELAERMGVSPGLIYLYEKAEREMPLSKIPKLAEALKEPNWIRFLQPDMGRNEATPIETPKAKSVVLTQEQRDRWEAIAMQRLVGIVDSAEDEEFLQELKVLLGDKRLTKWPPQELAGIQSVLTSARAQRALFAESIRTGTNG